MRRNNGAVRSSSSGRVDELVREWEASGLTQREYCRQRGIPVTTFNYHRRRQLMRQQEERAAKAESAGAASAALMPVTISPVKESGYDRTDWGFAVTLRNGRRIEAGWEFVELDLARLVRVAEQA